MCEGASKQSSDLKNYTAPGPRPPVLKFLDPPTINWCKVKVTCVHAVYLHVYAMNNDQYIKSHHHTASNECELIKF